MCVVVPSLLNVFLSFFFTVSEFSKKAGAGSNGGGEHSASTKNCQNRQSRAERGLVKWCAVHPSRDWLAQIKCTLTDAGYKYVFKPRPWHWSTQGSFQTTADMALIPKASLQCRSKCLHMTLDFLLNQNPCFHPLFPFTSIKPHLCLKFSLCSFGK